MDGFDPLGQVIICYYRSKLLWPRIDQMFWIPLFCVQADSTERFVNVFVTDIDLPNEHGRLDILKIHSKHMNKKSMIDYEALVKLSDGFNGADLRNICTEAGMCAIREDRDFVTHDDFVKAARKVGDSKKLETKLEYKKL